MVHSRETEETVNIEAGEDNYTGYNDLLNQMLKLTWL